MQPPAFIPWLLFPPPRLPVGLGTEQLAAGVQTCCAVHAVGSCVWLAAAELVAAGMARAASPVCYQTVQEPWADPAGGEAGECPQSCSLGCFALQAVKPTELVFP